MHCRHTKAFLPLTATALGLFLNLASAQDAPAVSLVPDTPTVAANPAAQAISNAQFRRFERGFEALPYFVEINGTPAGEAVLARLPDGSLLARDADFKRWNLMLPAQPTRLIAGQPYYLLSAVPGFTAQLDEPAQKVKLSFSATAFSTNAINVRQFVAAKAYRPGATGGYVDYAVSAFQQDAGSPIVGAQFNVGLFGAWGSANTLLVSNNFTGSQRKDLRLSSSYRYDWPETLNTLEIGDTVSGAGLLGRPVRLAGVRYSRNFSTQPGYITVPQPTLSGETSLPSILDVYLDGVRTQTSQIPAGPFQVNNLPVVNGSGEVQVVVRDALGREQLISQPYFTSSRQLRTGLSDYSYEAGLVRQNFGRVSNDYGEFVALGTHRYGLNSQFTSELHAELLGSGTQVLGGGGIVSLPYAGSITGGVLASHNGDTGFGSLQTITVEQVRRRRYNYGVRLQLADAKFRQAGLRGSQGAPQRQINVFAGLPLKGWGRVGLAYFSSDQRIQDGHSELISGSYTTRYKQASISLTAIHRIAPSESETALLSLSLPLGRQFNSNFGYQVSDSPNRALSQGAYARVQKGLPQGIGWGYRAGVASQFSGSGESFSADAGVDYNGEYGSYGLDVRESGSRTSLRANVSGSVGSYAKQPFASRELGSSFAIVTTGVADIPLSVYSQVTAYTNSKGVAVLPNLQPYQDNTVRIDPDLLPLDTQVPLLSFPATPYFGSGLLINLPVTRELSGEFVLLRTNGKPVPVGATVTLAGSSQAYPVGKNGQAYVRGLAVGSNTAVVRWMDGACTALVTLPENAGFQPKLGNVTCTEATP